MVSYVRVLIVRPVFFLQECLKPNVKSVLWEFGVRYCPSCKETLYVNINVSTIRPECLFSHALT